MIEDVPKKPEWPTPLVERIAKIDIHAATWLKDNFDELDQYYNEDCESFSKNAKMVNYMFDWDSTPQGYDYWNSLSKRIDNAN